MDPVSTEAPAEPVVVDEASPPEPSAVVTVVDSPVLELTAQIAALSAQIGELNTLARHREQTISRLHDEVQELRKGELSQALAPVFRDLIRLHDDLGNAAIERERAGDADNAKTFGYYCGEILEVLARNNVEPFDLQIGDRFDPTMQRAVRVVLSGDPALDRCIAVMHRRGFRLGTRVIRVAEVEVFRSEPVPPNDAAPQPPATVSSIARGEES